MSVFTRLYIYSPWSLDTADHTILLATAHVHNHYWLLHPPIVPNSQLGGLEAPAGAKPPAQSDIANDPWQHWYLNPGRSTYNLQPRVWHLNHLAIASRRCNWPFFLCSWIAGYSGSSVGMNVFHTYLLVTPVCVSGLDFHWLYQLMAA